MTPREIADLVSGGESETLEFKKTTGSLNSGMQTLCAMLNGKGGKVIFGVTPEGEITGQSFSDATLRDIYQSVAEIKPSVRPQVTRVEISETSSVLCITTESGASAPYSYRGKWYSRIGSSTRELDGEEINEFLLERNLGDNRWENQQLRDWSIGDLDEERIRGSFSKAISSGRITDPGPVSTADILRKWGLAKDGKLLRASAVLFGRREIMRERLPQCLLKFARFRGGDRSEFADSRHFHGNSLELLELAERLMRESLPLAGRIEPDLFVRKDDPVYPPVALREALANAFCHRDYSLHGNGVSIAVYDDRLEIISDGRLHFGLTVEMLHTSHESRPWNPLIAGVFHDTGLIEQWGRGTLQILELPVRAGLPRPEFAERSSCMSVTFKAGSYVPPSRVANDLTDEQRALLLVLNSARNGITLSQISQGLGGQVAVRKIKTDLAYLKNVGLVRLEGHGRGANWTIVNR